MGSVTQFGRFMHVGCSSALIASGNWTFLSDGKKTVPQAFSLQAAQSSFSSASRAR
jgi:hypothetical protein